MIGQEYRKQNESIVERLFGSLASDILWILPALAAGGLIYWIYLLTHPYPAFGAGLYLLMADQIAAHGYRLPATIPYYTAGGVPFAYPPLMFYVVAVLVNVFGFDPIAVARYLPGLVTLLYLIPFYAVANILLRSKARAGLATLIVAVTPVILRWHLSAGGIVRAPAFLFTILGIYTGLKLFTRGGRIWMVASTILFGLTVLTHPVYALFFVVNYLLLFVFYDPSLRGLQKGMVVGFGGIAIAIPWLLVVVSMHGLGVFTSAAGTHAGIGGGPKQVATMFGARLRLEAILEPGFAEVLLMSIWYLLPIVGTIYLLVKRRFFLPVWFIATSVLLGKGRFPFLIGGLISAVFLFDALVSPVRRWADDPTTRKVATGFALLAIVTLGASTGALFAASELKSHGGTDSLPAFIDADDVEAMQWVDQQTDRRADFVVLGDAAEWFPYLTHRTSLIGPWGVEWVSPRSYGHQLSMFNEVSTCENASCLTGVLRTLPAQPEYVYVPVDEFTLRGKQLEPQEELLASLRESPRYRVVFQNEGVAVVKVVEPIDSARLSGTVETVETVDPRPLRSGLARS